MTSSNDLQSTLLNLAGAKMTPKEMLKATRKAHPKASKKEIVRAAFASLIAVADHDADKALALQDFAITERGPE
jgi:hypothetical protein